MPDRIDRYEIRGVIGKGGMAEVFRAYDPRFKRDVAMKMISPEFLLESQFQKRFEQEAMVIARLQHPAIVPVYDFGEDNGRPFLVMRLMEGGSLQDRLDGHPIPLPETARLIRRLAPALDAVHSKGIVHRDLKPGNILFDEWDEPYLTDFGIVKIVEETESSLTKTGGIVGTPAYMSPEQVQGEKLDGRSDIYALGVILYELLTGVQPYHAGTAFSLALKHVSEPVPVIRDANPDLPPSIQVIVNHSLAKDREERYPTARVMAAEVDALARADDQDQGAVPVVGTGMVSAAEAIAVDVAAATLVDTPADPLPVLKKEAAQTIEKKRAVPIWAWIAGAVVLLLLIGGIYWTSGRGGVPNQGLSEADGGTPVPQIVPGAGTETSAPAAEETEQVAETALPPTETPSPPPTLPPTTTAPALYAPYEGTALPDTSLAVISPENTGGIEQLSRLGKGRITDAAYSPDGTLIAVASATGIYLYDSQSLREQGFFPVEALLNSIAFAPDGKSVAAGSADGAIRVWQVDDGVLRQTLEGHSGLVGSVAFAPDGSLLASGSDDNNARLWQVDSGELVHTLAGHTGGVNSVTFAAGGDLLATGSDDNSIRLWRVDDGGLANTLDGHTDEVNSVAVDAAGETLVSASSDNSVRLWRVSDGGLLNTLEGHRSRVFSAALSQDGQTVASGGSNGTLISWQAADGALLNTLEGHTAAVNSVAFAPDGQTLASVTADLVRLSQISDGATQETLQGHTSWVNDIAFAPDDQILASGNGNRQVLLWRMGDGGLLNILKGHSSLLRSVAFSPDGQILASGGDDYDIRLWRAEDGSLLKTLEGHSSPILALVFSADGERVASGAKDSVRVWQVADGVLVDSFPGNDETESMAFAPGGGRLATGLDDGSLLLQEMDGGALGHSLEGHENRVSSVAFSPDGETLTSGSLDALQLWEASSGILLDTFEGSTMAKNDLAFTPDGQIAAAASSNLVRLWRVSDGALLSTLPGHTSTVNSVTFSANGQLLASGSQDGTVRLWGVASDK